MPLPVTIVPAESPLRGMIESPMHALDLGITSSISIILNQSFWSYLSDTLGPTASVFWDGTVGQPYVTAPRRTAAAPTGLVPCLFQCMGTTDPITWGISSGALPTGLSLTDLGGYEAQIEGTPTVAGTYDFEVAVYIGALIVATYAGSIRVDDQRAISNLSDFNGFIAPYSSDGNFLAVSNRSNGQTVIGISFLGMDASDPSWAQFAYNGASSHLVFISQYGGTTYELVWEAEIAGPPPASWQSTGGPHVYLGPYNALTGGGPSPITIV